MNRLSTRHEFKFNLIQHRSRILAIHVSVHVRNKTLTRKPTQTILIKKFSTSESWIFKRLPGSNDYQQTEQYKRILPLWMYTIFFNFIMPFLFKLQRKESFIKNKI